MFKNDVDSIIFFLTDLSGFNFVLFYFWNKSVHCTLNIICIFLTIFTLLSRLVACHVLFPKKRYRLLTAARRLKRNGGRLQTERTVPSMQSSVMNLTD